MLILHISVDENAQLFEILGKSYSVNAPGDNILLGNDDAKFFDTPTINYHSVTAPSSHILLVNDDSQSFKNTPSKIAMQFQYRNRTHGSGQKLPISGKDICF